MLPLSPVLRIRPVHGIVAGAVGTVLAWIETLGVHHQGSKHTIACVLRFGLGHAWAEAGVVQGLASLSVTAQWQPKTLQLGDLCLLLFWCCSTGPGQHAYTRCGCSAQRSFVPACKHTGRFSPDKDLLPVPVRHTVHSWAAMCSWAVVCCLSAHMPCRAAAAHSRVLSLPVLCGLLRGRHMASACGVQACAPTEEARLLGPGCLATPGKGVCCQRVQCVWLHVALCRVR